MENWSVFYCFYLLIVVSKEDAINILYIFPCAYLGRFRRSKNLSCFVRAASACLGADKLLFNSCTSLYSCWNPHLLWRITLYFIQLEGYEWLFIAYTSISYLVVDRTSFHMFLLLYSDTHSSPRNIPIIFFDHFDWVVCHGILFIMNMDFIFTPKTPVTWSLNL